MVVRNFTREALLLLFLIAGKTTHATKSGENARWLVQESSWGTMSWLEGGGVSNMVTSLAEKDGRIFIYIPFGESFNGAMTFSEASVRTDLYEGAKCGADGQLDPEDPRCAKLTASCRFSKCADEEACKVAKETLFALHPQMAEWPADSYTVQEGQINDLWMIADYGGGALVDTEDYFASTAIRHKSAYGGRNLQETAVTTSTTSTSTRRTKPEFENQVAHARWLVSKSLWTTVSTTSVRLADVGWGNIRSVVDGECLFTSKGLPVFYLPTPDPTNIDVASNNQIALSFSEAALPELVNDEGSLCESSDPDAPTCAKISLQGNAVPIQGAALERALIAFGITHPRASWLSSGGAHTGGGYYTIDVTAIEFFGSFKGDMQTISVDDYKNYNPSPTDFPNEQFCVQSDTPAASEQTGQSTEHYDHGQQHGQTGQSTEHYEHGQEHGGQEHAGHDHSGMTPDHSAMTSNNAAESNGTTQENDITISANVPLALFAGMLLGFGFWGPLIYHKLTNQAQMSAKKAHSSSYQTVSSEGHDLSLKEVGVVETGLV